MKNSNRNLFELDGPLKKIGRQNEWLKWCRDSFIESLAKRTEDELEQALSQLKKYHHVDAALPLSEALMLTMAVGKVLASEENILELSPQELYAIIGLLIMSSGISAEAQSKHKLSGTQLFDLRVKHAEQALWIYQIFRIVGAIPEAISRTEPTVALWVDEFGKFAHKQGGKVALSEKGKAAVDMKIAKAEPLKQRVLDQYAHLRATGNLPFGKWHSRREASKDLYFTLVEPTKKVKKPSHAEDERWRTTYDWLLEFEKVLKM